MKTAVEWLFEELYNKDTINDYTIRVFEQAKEMEKNYYICSKCKSKLDEKDMQQMQNRKKD
jgi:hypothetical protein